MSKRKLWVCGWVIGSVFFIGGLFSISGTRALLGVAIGDSKIVVYQGTLFSSPRGSNLIAVETIDPGALGMVYMVIYHVEGTTREVIYKQDMVNGEDKYTEVWPMWLSEREFRIVESDAIGQTESKVIQLSDS